MTTRRVVPPDYQAQLARSEGSGKRLMLFLIIFAAFSIVGLIINSRTPERHPAIVRDLKVCSIGPADAEGKRKKICGTILPPLSGKVLVCGRIINLSENIFGPSFYLEKEGEEYPVDHGEFSGSAGVIDFCKYITLDSPDRSGNYSFEIVHYRETVASVEFQVLKR
jgi:hypothetical protein